MLIIALKGQYNQPRATPWALNRITFSPVRAKHIHSLLMLRPRGKKGSNLFIAACNIGNLNKSDPFSDLSKRNPYLDRKKSIEFDPIGLTPLDVVRACQ